MSDRAAVHAQHPVVFSAFKAGGGVRNVVALTGPAREFFPVPTMLMNVQSANRSS